MVSFVCLLSICLFVAFGCFIFLVSQDWYNSVRDEAHGKVAEKYSMMKKILPQGPLAIHHVPENSKFIAEDSKLVCLIWDCI